MIAFPQHLLRSLVTLIDVSRRDKCRPMHPALVHEVRRLIPRVYLGSADGLEQSNQVAPSEPLDILKVPAYPW